MAKPEPLGQDETYGEAAPRAMGVAFGEILLGMLDTGMPRSEAITVLMAYVNGLAAGLRPTPPPGQPREMTQDG